MERENVFIIAEAGVNHNGSLGMAKQLVDIAFDCGADAVKFQTFKTENLVATNTPKADYQKETTSPYESQYEMIKKLELSYNQFKELKSYCDAKNILFLSTPFDLESIDFLSSLELPIFKIPSGEMNNYPFLKAVAKRQRKIILSSGMATLDEIGDSLSVLQKFGSKKEDITVLHCNTAYPTPANDINLNAIRSIRKAFEINTGFSDHSEGIELSVAAVALGATVIEKHFTLSKNLPGPDHQASLTPFELKSLVSSIRNVEKAMGDGIKKPTPSELPNILPARKSIVAKKHIRAGETFREDNLSTLRPSHGVSPMKWELLIGKIAQKNYTTNEFIDHKELEI